MTLAIYCAGGLGKETIELARIVNRWDVIVFVDDVTDKKIYREAHVYRFEEIARFEDTVEFIVASGEPAARKALYEKIKAAGYSLATLVSPWVSTYPGTTFGEGCILWDCSLSADIVVEPNVLINTKVIVGHDTGIGAHSVISAKRGSIWRREPWRKTESALGRALLSAWGRCFCAMSGQERLWSGIRPGELAKTRRGGYSECLIDGKPFII